MEKNDIELQEIGENKNENEDELPKEKKDQKDFSKIYDDECPTDENRSECEYNNFIESSEDNDGENRNLDEDKKVSQFAVMVTMINCLIGTGIINLPYIYKSLGIYLATLSTIVSMIISANSVYFLMRTKVYTHRYSYAVYAKLAYGTVGTIGLRIVFILKNFFTCCVRLKVFGNLSQNLTLIFLKISGIKEFPENQEPTEFYLQKSFFIIVVFFLVMPLMFKDDVSGLKKFNIFGVYSVYFFVFTLAFVSVYKFFKKELLPFDTIMLYPTISVAGAINCVGALFDAFSFHANVFPLYLTMKDRSAKKMNHISIQANGITAFLYTIAGFCGFVMFRDELNKDVFSNFKNEVIFYKEKNIFLSFLLFLSLIGFFISALFGFPIFFMCLKNNSFNFFMIVKKKLLNKDKSKENKKELIEKEFIEEKEIKKEAKTENKSFIQKYAFTFCCYCLVLFTTLNVDSVIALNSLAGSTFGNIINFLAPTLFLMHFSKKSLCSYERIAALFTLIVSIITFIWWGINLKK